MKLSLTREGRLRFVVIVSVVMGAWALNSLLTAANHTRDLTTALVSAAVIMATLIAFIEFSTDTLHQLTELEGGRANQVRVCCRLASGEIKLLPTKKNTLIFQGGV